MPRTNKIIIIIIIIIIKKVLVFPITKCLLKKKHIESFYTVI